MLHSIIIFLLVITNVINIQSYISSRHTAIQHSSRSTTKLQLLPNDIVFDAGQVEIIRMIGKIDVQIDKQILDDAMRGMKDEKKMKEFKKWSNGIENTATSVRIFEARITGGTRCFLKEFLPVGMSFGRRELSTTRKLVYRWNELHPETDQISTPPFPILLGSIRTDGRVEDPEFRNKWIMQFPTTKPPGANNLWLIYRWDNFSFKSVKTFPRLPQVIEGLDYFRKNERSKKRWRFVRKIIRSSLESIDFIHRAGYCHNAVNSESIWISTTDQLQIKDLTVTITDLGATQKFSELGGEGAREGTFQDMYQLGLVFLELILSSFSEDNTGAEIARSMLDGSESLKTGILTSVTDRNLNQLSQKEIKLIFEDICDSDFKTFRDLVRSIDDWTDAVSILEQDNGAAWKLIFKLLAGGRLYDNEKEKQLRITGNSLVRENKILFSDTFSN